MKILVLGDVVGDPGRKALREFLPKIKAEGRADFIIVNGENAAGGIGLTPAVAQEMLNYGVDVITSGDHVWKYPEIGEWMDEHPQAIRPINYPEGAPGSGSAIVKSAQGIKVGVINALGRVFLATVDCPFKTVETEIKKLREQTKIILVDIHAEATSEKVALGYFLDGRVSAVVGTHTHIQTADEQILPGGTAYITDLGMVGPYESVLGRDIDSVLRKFLTQMPTRFPVAKNKIRMCGVLIEVDPESGRALRIERVNQEYPQKTDR